MRRLLTTSAVVTALVTACIIVPPAFADPGAHRVVIVLAPYLTWDDVTPTRTPTIWSLAEAGAIGNINARSRAREPGEPSSPLEGALTISAGAWAVPSYSAAAAFMAEEHYEVGTAAEAFRRSTGDLAGMNQIVFLGMPRTVRLNAERSFKVVLGTLGQAVRDAGGVTAAVGNSDVGYVTGEQRKVRPAALAAMDGDGLVARGEISGRLLREDPNAPFGIETDLVEFAEALDAIDEETASIRGPGLVVLDAGDAYRATKFEPQVTPGIASVHRERAITTLDEVVRLARERFDGNDVLILASQSTGDPLSGRLEGLGPVVVHGGGWSGYLTSTSTQRTGVVTNLDLTATVLEALDLRRPVQVLGNPMTVVEAPASLPERVGELSRMASTAVAVDAGKPGVVNAFVIATVLALFLTGFTVVRWRHWSERATRLAVLALRSALLFVLAVPLASWLAFAWMRWPATSGEAVAALFVTTLALWASSLVLLRVAPLRVPVGVMSLLTAMVLLVDQFLGAPASFTNFFGYSPLMAARFYGIGNEAAAILFGSSVVGAALVLDEYPAARWTPFVKRAGLPLFGSLVVVVCSAPFLGANVGVIAWGTIGFVLAWVLMNGHQVTARTVVWTIVAVVLAVAAFAAIDLLGSGQQTHLGRALESAGTGGLVELWKIVERKAETNIRVLTHTNWAYILIAVMGFLAFMRWRPQGDFAQTLGENPHFADAITVSLVAGLAAYFTEDSGIVIPALEVFYVGVAIAWLMLARVDQRARRAETR